MSRTEEIARMIDPEAFASRIHWPIRWGEALDKAAAIEALPVQEGWKLDLDQLATCIAQGQYEYDLGAAAPDCPRAEFIARRVLAMLSAPPPFIGGVDSSSSRSQPVLASNGQTEAGGSGQGRALCEAFAATFESGGWTDGPVWADFDDQEQDRFNRTASIFLASQTETPCKSDGGA